MFIVDFKTLSIYGTFSYFMKLAIVEVAYKLLKLNTSIFLHCILFFIGIFIPRYWPITESWDSKYYRKSVLKL